VREDALTRSRWIAYFLVALLLGPAATLGQSAEFLQAYDRYSEMIAEGRYQEAIPVAAGIIELGESELGPSHPNLAAMLNNLAGLHDALGHATEAEPLYQRALAIQENALGLEHPDVATNLENYAALFRATGRSAEAAEMGARAKAIRMKQPKDI
jgi:tetratricopeptide (TPR) repeat protein